MDSRLQVFNSQQIVALRPDVERPLPSDQPLSTLLESEADGAGGIAQALTVFLRGSECQFRCLMCDLWKFTTGKAATPSGSIPQQIRNAIGVEQAEAGWIKLYNASNFFSKHNVPKEDLPTIASLVAGFERVIVENHPRILNDAIESFREDLGGRLEVAMGLETIHPDSMAFLNKQMTLDDFARACEWLNEKDVDTRAFVLLRLPGMSEQEGIEWALKSVEYADSLGARHVSIIPMRGGNGAIEQLKQKGQFESPVASSLEFVLNECLATSDSIVTVDLWDWDRMAGHCSRCSQLRRSRLQEMNLTQTLRPFVPVDCNCVS